MDRYVTVRFFEVAKSHNAVPDFEVALQNAFKAGATAAARQRDVGGTIIRLERLSPNNSFWDGEFVRKQADNIPPEAHDQGMTPLSLGDGSGLGHSVAFRYSPTLKVIAIQADPRAVSIGRMMGYLKCIDLTHDYVPRTLVRKDAWDRYRRGKPRKMVIEIAAPTDFQTVEGNESVRSVVESATRIAEATKAPIVTIGVSMGHQRGSLAGQAVEKVLRYFTEGAGRQHDVRKLSVLAPSEDGRDPIDFIEDSLREGQKLPLSGNDLDVNYRTRRNYLEACFNKHFDYIRQTYGG